MKPKLLLFLLLLILSPSPLPAATDDNLLSPVVIALNDWASQRVLSRAVGSAIKQRGFEIHYQDILPRDQWGALSKGIVDIQVEVWQETMSNEFESFVNRGFILDLGNHQATGREEWWYPEYVEDMCPGLPHWRALKDCFALFSRESSQGKGVFYAGPWVHHYGSRIRALALNFTIERLEDETSIWRVLQQASIEGRPILIYNWSPNWVDNRLNGKFIEFPAFHEDCHNQASWGINPDMSADCGGPATGWIKKVSSRRLKLGYPCLYQVLAQIDFSAKMLADASAFVVVENLSEQEAAIKWQEKYKHQWQSWFDVPCLAKIKK